MSGANTIEVIARAVIRRGDQVLLCQMKEGANWWFLPGGHVEFGELVKEALLRELEEELGLRQVTIKSLIGTVENKFPVGDRIQHELNLVFEVEETEEQLIESREVHLEFAFLDVNETLILPTALQNGLLEWLNSGKTFWKGLEPERVR
ncbi:NUDIX domain-containing protein [Rhodomicrobium lacus]|uniref:NUDIX domain-containing protein n=1 Tax=Rhodomicrobium lacus TaxID=2498452 RepID=UPI0026E3EB42|nr:NUDIX domain-containing protein [Rhodomicrobium lacus]WKW51395.1 NUDIX domain-containing protein [Rhodomicrobium lacus]